MSNYITAADAGIVGAGTSGQIAVYGAANSVSGDTKLDDGATVANTLTYTGTGGISLTGTAAGIVVNNTGVVGWSDTAMSRDAAGVFDFGTGAQGNKGGTINATTANITGTSTLGTVAATTINGAALSGTFTGTPTFSGAVTFSSTINKVTLTAPATAATITIANNKTLTVNNTLSFSGTDSQTFTFPAATDTVACLGTVQTFSAAQSFSSTIRQNSAASGDIGTIQIANGDDCVFIKRNTDTSPTGNFFNCQNAAAATLYQVDITGTLKKYAGISTSANGLAMVAGSTVTSFSAAATATNIVASTPAAGRYLITFHVQLTSAGGVSSTLGGTNGFQLTYTSQDGSVSIAGIKPTYTLQSASLTSNTTATFFSGTATIACANATAISFTCDYTSSGTAMVYEVRTTAIYLG